MMEKDPPIMINEYRNGNFVRSWNGIAECARAYHIGFNLLKTLIATDTRLPWEDAVDITFDIAGDSPYHYEMVEDARTKRKEPMLIMDVEKVIKL